MQIGGLIKGAAARTVQEPRNVEREVAVTVGVAVGFMCI